MIELGVVYTCGKDVFVFEKDGLKYRRFHLDGYYSGWIAPRWYLEQIEKGDFVNTGLSLEVYKLVNDL